MPSPAALHQKSDNPPSAQGFRIDPAPDRAGPGGFGRPNTGQRRPKTGAGPPPCPMPGLRRRAARGRARRPSAHKRGSTGRPARPAVPPIGSEFERKPPTAGRAKGPSPFRAVVGEGWLFLRDVASSWRRNRGSAFGQLRAPLLDPFLNLFFRALVGRLIIPPGSAQVILGDEVSWMIVGVL